MKIKIPANTKKAAINSLKKIISKAEQSPLKYGHPYNKVMAYTDGYIIWTTNIDIEVPKNTQYG